MCDLLLEEGRCCCYARGIHEPRRGFRIEHDAFLLYPNVEHQNAAQLRPELHPRLQTAPAAPRASGEVLLPGYCRVVDVVQLKDEAQARALQPLTCWTASFFEQRLAYKPERPLFAVTVRLPPASPCRAALRPPLRGCRSWVPLRQAVDEATLATAVPALPEGPSPPTAMPSARPSAPPQPPARPDRSSPAIWHHPQRCPWRAGARRGAGMFLGHQMGDLSDRKLQWAAQLGVEHIACEIAPGSSGRTAPGTWRGSPP